MDDGLSFSQQGLVNDSRYSSSGVSTHVVHPLHMETVFRPAMDSLPPYSSVGDGFSTSYDVSQEGTSVDGRDHLNHNPVTIPVSALDRKRALQLH